MLWRNRRLPWRKPCKNAGLAAGGIVFVAILMAMLFGAMMGVVYGLFTITLRCNQNVTGLTITTFGAGVLGFWGSMMSNEGTTFYEVSKVFTAPFFGNVENNWFSQMFLSHGVLVYVGIIITVLVAIFMNRTKTGLNLKAVGENPAAADAAGINVIRYKYLACIIGSAISGIGGVFYLLDCTRGSLEYVIEGLGWLAVALVIFSLWRPGLCIIGSFIFGLLYIMPNYITGVSLAEKELVKSFLTLQPLSSLLLFRSLINARRSRLHRWGFPISGKKDNSKKLKRSSSDGLIYCQNATM